MVSGGTNESPVTVTTSNDYVGKFESTDAHARLIVEDNTSTTGHNGLQVFGNTCMLVAGNAFSVRGIGGGATELLHAGTKKAETSTQGLLIPNTLGISFGDAGCKVTGTAGSGGSAGLFFMTNSGNKWQIDGNGHFRPSADLSLIHI